MKKIIISKLFLYKYRFIIGYVLLGLAFVGLLFTLPLFAQHGLSEAEMESATSSFQLSFDAPANGGHEDGHQRTEQVEEAVGQIGEGGDAQHGGLRHTAGVPRHEHGLDGAKVSRRWRYSCY